jgi:uncharacterized membrane protein YozB (DUF420 family)
MGNEYILRKEAIMNAPIPLILPTLNAILNATAAVLLVLGFRQIRKGRRQAHAMFMIAAFIVSVLFLISYLTYHALYGHVRYPGAGWPRTLYLAILITHTTLAPLAPVLALVALWRAAHRQFSRHRAVARWTLPLWLYVSVTGVIVYGMLYIL